MDPMNEPASGKPDPVMEPENSELLKKAVSCPPDFASRKIEAFPKEKFETLRQFVLEEYLCGGESVNVFEVVGTSDPGYQGMSWLTLLKRGEKMRLNLPLLDLNPDYYLETRGKKPAMSFIKLDGKLYIDKDGNHRTCIAKFFFYYQGRTHLHGVDLVEYRIDRKMLYLCSEIEKSLEEKGLTHLRVDPYQKILGREDTAGWKRAYFEVGLSVTHRGTSQSVRIVHEEASVFLKTLQRLNRFNRIWISTREEKKMKQPSLVLWETGQSDPDHRCRPSLREAHPLFGWCVDRLSSEKKKDKDIESREERKESHV